MMSRIGVKKADFELKRYVKDSHLLHPKKQTSFHFKDGLIKKLPLIKDGSKDLYDLTNNIKKFSLVLRVSKTAKTFYIKPAQRTMIKLGRWQEPNANTHIKPEAGCLTTSLARSAFKKKVKEILAEEELAPEILHVREWTIEDYLSQQYKKDRAKYKIKNGSIRPISQKSLNAIKRDIKPLLTQRLKDANKNWLEILDEHWKKEVVNPTNDVVTMRSLDTNRKAYTQINAMLNVWVGAGYIRKNPIDGEVARFKDEHADQREIITFDELSIESVLRYLWQDDVLGSKAAKLVLATMIVAGVRNSEAYRNTTDNFRISERIIFIPSLISGKTRKSRTIPIESDYYWQMISDYLASDEYFENEQNHMFPSRKGSRTGHITEGATRKPWHDLKNHFKLPTESRPYDFRHTFASNLAKTEGIEVTSQLLGDNPDTVMKYYIKHDAESVRPALREIQNNKKHNHRNQRSHKANDPVVTVSESDMPNEVKLYFKAFVNGLEIVEQGKLYRSQWKVFIEKLRQLNQKKQVEDIDDWLIFQTD
ncbi:MULTISPECIES: tyrosine-type recombinase/integrase [Photobacterium]|uniref:tyrosine-type recombinase/integrase n=1 Tax=Photobacterium TaxID=657 RepID=UPI0027331E4E|nr:tyrosine-type recombinase/integrase [Photobacterium leiognathi]